MNKDEILVPILTAINDLREEVRENRRAIQTNREAIEKNREAIEKNRDAIQKNSELIKCNKDSITSLESRMERHEQESRKDRKAILDILHSYEQVTDRQYKENKMRIERLEQKFEMISA